MQLRWCLYSHWCLYSRATRRACSALALSTLRRFSAFFSGSFSGFVFSHGKSALLCCLLSTARARARIAILQRAAVGKIKLGSTKACGTKRKPIRNTLFSSSFPGFAKTLNSQHSPRSFRCVLSDAPTDVPNLTIRPQKYLGHSFLPRSYTYYGRCV